MGVFSETATREKPMLRAISSLVTSGREGALLDYISYEAASAFAEENGAIMSPYKNGSANDTLYFYLDIFGVEYHICVQRWMEDDTLLRVILKAKEDETMKRMFPLMMENDTLLRVILKAKEYERMKRIMLPLMRLEAGCSSKVLSISC